MNIRRPLLALTPLLCMLLIVVPLSRADEVASPGVADTIDAPPRFHWVDCGEEKLWLQEQGKTVMMFQLAPKSQEGKYARANYVHPLHGPDGGVVTEDFPPDHLHHRGVFWAWHQLLLNGKQLADPWVCQDIEWKTPEQSGCWSSTRASELSAGMMVARDWVVPDPEQAGQSLRVVRETVRITAWPSSDNRRILDFDLRFRALLRGVSIGGSDDEKGYGGFSPRFRLADDAHFVGPQGEVTPRELAGVDGGAWIDVSGTDDDIEKGVVMMVHPSHPGFPLQWILRTKGSMQNPRWPGREPVRLSTRTELRLRYRLVLHVGALDAEALQALWQDYAKNAEQ